MRTTACALLSCAAALVHTPAPRRTTILAAKQRDYMAGGLGSSKQENFARLWRDKDAPIAPPVKDETTFEREISAFEAAAELVPDAHWRTRGVPDVSKAAASTGRSVAVEAWAALRSTDGAPYSSEDAWADVDGDARSLILVVGEAKGVDTASNALHDRLPRRVGRIVAVFATAAQAAKRRKRIGGKVAVLHDEAGTFAQACGVDAANAGVVVLAPPHPSPEQHTIVARFPAQLDGVAGAVERTLREKGALPNVRRTG